MATVLGLLVLAAALGAAGLTALTLLPGGGSATDASAGGATNPAHTAARSTGHTATARPPPRHAFGRTPDMTQVHVTLHRPPRSALLVDERSGQVLWSLHPERRLPIASITKLMTALLTVEHEPPNALVKITRAAVATSGSKVGVLPRGRDVRLETLLYGLLLPSGNDAAVALAQKVAHTVPRFVRLMNATAQRLGLTCTRYASPSGIVDRGNYSCAPDLALLAHDVLAQPRLARIVKSPSAILPLPIKGHRVWLYNNNWLMNAHYAGVDGVKTGFTDAAGVSLVSDVRRGRSRLLLVMLHSPNVVAQSAKLFDAGFTALAHTRG